MFETCYMLKVSKTAKAGTAGTAGVGTAGYPVLQSDYLQCWQAMPKLFDGSIKPRLPWEVTDAVSEEVTDAVSEESSSLPASK
jgi:hypothetical protein